MTAYINPLNTNGNFKIKYKKEQYNIVSDTAFSFKIKFVLRFMNLIPFQLNRINIYNHFIYNQNGYLHGRYRWRHARVNTWQVFSGAINSCITKFQFPHVSDWDGDGSPQVIHGFIRNYNRKKDPLGLSHGYVGVCVVAGNFADG